jgi:hypothetical protein
MTTKGFLTTGVRRWVVLLLAVGFGALITGSGCPPQQSNAQVSAFILETFQTAEDVAVEGTGFTPNGQVKISFIGLPGRSVPLQESAVLADASGNLPRQVYRFTYTASLTCDVNSTVTVTVSATDIATGSPTFTTVNLDACDAPS